MGHQKLFPQIIIYTKKMDLVKRIIRFQIALLITDYLIDINVKNAKTFIPYLEEKQFSYEVLDENTINIYGKINMSAFMIDLSKNNLFVEEIHEKGESLENYYMNLIGGDHHD